MRSTPPPTAGIALSVYGRSGNGFAPVATTFRASRASAARTPNPAMTTSGHSRARAFTCAHHTAGSARFSLPSILPMRFCCAYRIANSSSPSPKRFARSSVTTAACSPRCLA
jgi:hypothetical protein